MVFVENEHVHLLFPLTYLCAWAMMRDDAKDASTGKMLLNVRGGVSIFVVCLIIDEETIQMSAVNASIWPQTRVLETPCCCTEMANYVCIPQKHKHVSGKFLSHTWASQWIKDYGMV